MSLSGGRESLLTREVKDLKSKLMTKTDELNEAIKSNSEVHCISCMRYITVYFRGILFRCVFCEAMKFYAMNFES